MNLFDYYVFKDIKHSFFLLKVAFNENIIFVYHCYVNVNILIQKFINESKVKL